MESSSELSELIRVPLSMTDMISDMQPRFGDEAALSLCRSRGGGYHGHGSWPAGAGG